MADEALVRDIARVIIERVAPQELVIFYPESKAYFRDPQGALDAARKRASAKPKDREAGYGAAEMVEVLTPFALAVAGAVVEPLIVGFVQSATARTREAAQAMVLRLFRRAHPAAAEDESVAEPIALSAQERARLRQQAYQEGLRLGLDDSQAQRLADGLIDGLDGQQP